MAADDLGSMLVEFKADLSDLDKGAEQAKKKLGEVDKSAKDTGGGFKDLLKNATSFATGMAVFHVASDAVGFLKDQLGGVLQESIDAQAGMALTNAVLKSTHDVSGMTAQGIADLAGNLSHLTKFSDDTTQAAENMLLTFTNIGHNVFPQATKTVLDMSQALGQDTKSSAIQLGKALNDPIAGITALSRVGVTFDDQQKKLIKTYMDHNQIAKAQGVILKELQREFGGAATAAGKTFGGQMVIANQYLSDFKQTLGDALMPVVTQFLGEIEKVGMPILQTFSDWFTKDGLPGLESFAGGLASTVDKSGAFQSVLKTVSDILPDVEKFAGNVGNALENDLLPPTLSLIKNFSAFIDNSGLLKDALHGLGDAVATVSGFLGPLIGDLSNVFGWLSKNKPVTDALVTSVEILGGAFVALKIANTVTGFQQMFTKISEGDGLVSGLAGTFKDKLGSAIGDFLKTHAPNFKQFLDDIGGKAKTAGDNVADIGTNAKISATDVAGAAKTEEVALTNVETEAATTGKTVGDIGVYAKTSAVEVEAAATGEEAALAGVSVEAEAADVSVAALGPAAVTAEAEAAPALGGMAAGFSSILGLTALIPINIMSFQDAMDNAWNDVQSQDWGSFFSRFSPGDVGGTLGTDINLLKHYGVDLGPSIGPPTPRGSRPGGRGFASGGPVEPGWFVAGERGTELIHAGSSGYVYNHAQTMAMMGGGGGEVHIHVYFDGQEMAGALAPHVVSLMRAKTGTRA